jgi:hypothetical protein
MKVAVLYFLFMQLHHKSAGTARLTAMKEALKSDKKKYFDQKVVLCAATSPGD